MVNVQVKIEQGLQMLKIFKEHSSKTCILDDFAFYEARQKTIQEKKAKQQQFQKQVILWLYFHRPVVGDLDASCVDCHYYYHILVYPGHSVVQVS